MPVSEVGAGVEVNDRMTQGALAEDGTRLVVYFDKPGIYKLRAR